MGGGGYLFRRDWLLRVRYGAMPWPLLAVAEIIVVDTAMPPGAVAGCA